MAAVFRKHGASQAALARETHVNENLLRNTTPTNALDFAEKYTRGDSRHK